MSPRAFQTRVPSRAQIKLDWFDPFDPLSLVFDPLSLGLEVGGWRFWDSETLRLEVEGWTLEVEGCGL